MTDTALPHIPRFVFGSTDLTLTHPVTRWIPGARTNGLVMKTATGVPGPVTRLRKYTLAMTLRFTEEEWTSVSAFINYGQTGASFLWYHGEDNDAIPSSFTVTLGTPRVATGVRPSRDTTLPWLMTLPIVLESDDVWYLEYFGISEIPHLDQITFVARTEVTLLDDTIGITGATEATAVIFDSHDVVLDQADHPVVWSSSDVTVATVDQDGLVTAVGSGVCNIIATSDGVLGFQTLSVEAVPALDATGGTRVEIDGYVYHKFTASGNFVVAGGASFVEILLVAGGGAGGSSQDRTGGGGGAGGMKEVTGIPITPGTYAIVVGAGGAAGTISPAVTPLPGGNSTGLGQSVTGGGRGGGFHSSAYTPGNGGSGGGQKHNGPGNVGGTGIAGQGFKGGDFGISDATGTGRFVGSGGGGASQAGFQGDKVNPRAGAGGAGAVSSITGVAVTYAGGGGGSASNYGGQAAPLGGLGGVGGGGNGGSAVGAISNGTAGTDGLGGGGGAGGFAGANGGRGGSGVVIIRYPMV